MVNIGSRAQNPTHPEVVSSILLRFPEVIASLTEAYIVSAPEAIPQVPRFTIILYLLPLGFKDFFLFISFLIVRRSLFVFIFTIFLLNYPDPFFFDLVYRNKSSKFF